MTASPEQPPNQPETKGIALPLLKASLVASCAFALAWMRVPMSRADIVSIIGIFIGYGMLIGMFSMVIGAPLVRLLMRFRARRWWVYLLAGVVAGVLLDAVFSAHPSLPTLNARGDVYIDNPRSLVFSPWTRTRIVGLPTWTDYYGSLAFGAAIGGVLGLSFWYFAIRRSERAA